ncbi:hypothetical protein [Streptomyces tropicalis]|uniref:Uncharacterized protein n=1 Tax=Streptomyces tropicalis TaxID=3034234 RepID=A0ABT6A842_9ACTN|nr:hypothetical protein [Streptomyces tropicalis]MDF3300825.1 hypothetical protein [Streptomyces tropicalis]
MQWTDGNGGAYGEDPYGGAGYAYAYGHEGYGHHGHGGEVHGHEGYGGDTATLYWDPVQLAQGAPSPAPWEADHGDVLTVEAPETGTRPVPFVPAPESGPGPDPSESESARPVFVDSSGRRQRLVRRAARLLVIPAGGYVALLISTMLGGPGISAPFVPQAGADRPATPRVTAPDSPSGTGHATEGAGATATHGDTRPATVRTASAAAGRTAAPAAPAAASAPTAAASPTATATPTPTPAPTPSSHGRALGTSHKPVK